MLQESVISGKVSETLLSESREAGGIWSCPPYSSIFTGRSVELVELHKQLTKEKNCIVITGLGGIGKSELAKAYASEYYENGYYNNCIWIDGENYGSIIPSLEKLQEKYQFHSKNEDPFITIQLIMEQLSYDEKNLLIIDNMTETEIVNNLLKSSYQFHLLITSRISIWPSAVKVLNLQIQTFNLQLLTLAQARELILTCEIIQSNNPSIDKLAETLG